MDEELDIRDRLAGVDVPPSRIEMEALVVAGRRRAFRRRTTQAVGGVAVATAILLAAPFILTGAGGRPPTLAGAATADVSAAASASASASAGPAGKSCEMTELAAPPGMNDVSVTAVDPTGRHIVGYNLVGQNFIPVLWTERKPQALPLVGMSVELNAVNTRGVVVGLVTEADSQSYVFRYEKGRYTRLKTPTGTWNPHPYAAINAAGDVVINVKTGAESTDDSIALLWKAGSTTAVKLPLPAGASVREITDDGVLIGTIYVGGYATEAYTWDLRGNGRKLELPAGTVGAAYAVSGEWVTGGLWPAARTGDYPGLPLWNRRTGALTQLPLTGPGSAVNASGLVVSSDGRVVRDGSEVGLAIPAKQRARAVDISDSGLVVGQAQTDGEESVNIGPRVWQC